MKEIAGLIDRVLAAPSDEANLKRSRSDVSGICGKFPFYSRQREGDR